jgi:hypothetical protein
MVSTAYGTYTCSEWRALFLGLYAAPTWSRNRAALRIYAAAGSDGVSSNITVLR